MSHTKRILAATAIAAISSLSIVGIANASSYHDAHHSDHYRGHQHSDDLGDVVNHLLDAVGRLL